MARKKSIEEQIVDLSASIRLSVQHWKEVKAKGTTDPFWPDGTNLNLVRNHIIYDKGKLRELCKGRKGCPVEVRVKVPKRVSEGYMAPNSKAARHACPLVRSKK
jgi:hypothetical protein